MRSGRPPAPIEFTIERGEETSQIALGSMVAAAFARRAWDRAPAVIRQPFAASLPSPAQLFRAALANSEASRNGDTEAGLRLYVEHVVRGAGLEDRYVASELAEPRPYLPLRRDGSLRRYIDRVTRELGLGVGLIVNDIQRHDSSLWEAMLPFPESLYRHVGVPSGGVHLDLFAGNYRHTPFGIHKDDQHVFTLVIAGRKRFTVWPLEAFAGRAELPADLESIREAEARIVLRDGIDHANAMRHAVVLEGGPGDILYWPSSYWHRAQGAGNRALTLVWGFNVSPRIFDSVQHPALQGGRSRQIADEDLDSVCPPAIRSRLAALARQNASPAIRRDALAAWLRFSTARACLVAPEPRPPASLYDGDRIAASPRWPIAWASLDRGVAVISAAGHTMELNADPPTLSLVRSALSHLHMQPSARTGDLLARFSGARADSRERMRAILEKLYSWRAIGPIDTVTVRSAEPARPRARADRIHSSPVAVRRSRIHGCGVFATRMLRKGMRLLEYKGERITDQEARARYPEPAARKHVTYLFYVHDGLVIDGRVGGGVASSVNHSCDPNCVSVVEGERVFLRTLRKIHPSEELSYDYRLCGPQPLRRILKRNYACRCGSTKCRGTLIGVNA